MNIYMYIYICVHTMICLYKWMYLHVFPYIVLDCDFFLYMYPCHATLHCPRRQWKVLVRAFSQVSCVHRWHQRNPRPTHANTESTRFCFVSADNSALCLSCPWLPDWPNRCHKSQHQYGWCRGLCVPGVGTVGVDISCSTSVRILLLSVLSAYLVISGIPALAALEWALLVETVWACTFARLIVLGAITAALR